MRSVGANQHLLKRRLLLLPNPLPKLLLNRQKPKSPHLNLKVNLRVSQRANPKNSNLQTVKHQERPPKNAKTKLKRPKKQRKRKRKRMRRSRKLKRRMRRLRKKLRNRIKRRKKRSKRNNRLK